MELTDKTQESLPSLECVVSAATLEPGLIDDVGNRDPPLGSVLLSMGGAGVGGFLPDMKDCLMVRTAATSIAMGSIWPKLQMLLGSTSEAL
jgi:hypothetical protein